MPALFPFGLMIIGGIGGGGVARLVKDWALCCLLLIYVYIIFTTYPPLVYYVLRYRYCRIQSKGKEGPLACVEMGLYEISFGRLLE